MQNAEYWTSSQLDEYEVWSVHLYYDYIAHWAATANYSIRLSTTF